MRVPLLNQANQAIWQKSWFASIVVTVFSWTRLQDKRRRQNCFAAKEWASKLEESDKGSYYNQEKWLKDDKAPEKPIETTTQSSFTRSLASGASFLGREAAK